MEEVGEGVLVLVLIHTDRGKGEVEVAAMVGQVLLHGDHVAISSNKWRARKLPRWDADSGHFCSELDLGPKTKFAYLAVHYNFC